VKPSVEQLENLLAQRRDERAPEGYWQDFLCEFHQRQRESRVKRWTVSGMFQRTTNWFGELGHAKWLYGAGLGYAALTAAFLTYPRQVETASPIVPVKHQVIPAPELRVQQLDKLDLAPSTQGSIGEQEF
jgi:hypothetical protein